MSDSGYADKVKEEAKRMASKMIEDAVFGTVRERLMGMVMREMQHACEAAALEAGKAAEGTTCDGDIDWFNESLARINAMRIVAGIKSTAEYEEAVERYLLDFMEEAYRELERMDGGERDAAGSR